MNTPEPVIPPRFDPVTLPQVGYHPGPLAYWVTPYCGNAMYMAGEWLEFTVIPDLPADWGSRVALWNNPQFDENGYPRYLNDNTKLRAAVYGLHTNYENRPPTWPRRSTLAEGRVVLSWEGDADIRMHGEFIEGESAEGSLVNGRRVYQVANANLSYLLVHEIRSPVTDIKVWLPDPADPQSASLENQFFHPLFLDRLRDRDWGFIRFMSLLETNNNPQQDWGDRRRPTHCFGHGVLNPRSPVPGRDAEPQDSGMAYEHMTALCNQVGLDCWVCVPHLATDDFVTRLAQLIRFGSDGIEAYSSEQDDPVYPPLNAGRRVFIEYSNEIWSGGSEFLQGQWAENRANEADITKAQFNARRFCEIWRIFQEVFEGSNRLIRVAAVWAAGQGYTTGFLNEIISYGQLLTPPVEPDVVAPTTYFSNGIQDWVYDKAVAQIGTDDPWFLTSEQFDPGDGNFRPVSLPADDAYWTGNAMERHMAAAFAEWTRRLLSGDAQEGAGPDAVGIGGGYGIWLRELALTAFSAPKAIVVYEGGPSIYTNDRDSGLKNDAGITIFMEAMNRHPGMRHVYDIHLNMAKSMGLRSQVGFTDCSKWGRNGQWGHLEHLAQEPNIAVKYQFLLDFSDEMLSVRHIDDIEGSAPQFDTDPVLPVAQVGAPYSTEIAVSGGQGARTVKLLGKYLAPGLNSDALPDERDRVRISGTPTQGLLGYLYLRVTDESGNSNWRIFTLASVGGPGTLVEFNFAGTNPARNLPWARFHVLADGITCAGWQFGSGNQPQDGDNALVWAQNMSDEDASTLDQAIADQQYLGMSLQDSSGLNLRRGEVCFSIRRIGYHSPRRYAVFSSLGGFSSGAEIFDTGDIVDTNGHDFRFALDDSITWENLTEPVEFRIYGFAGQYGGHRTSLTAFKLPGNTTMQQLPIASLTATPRSGTAPLSISFDASASDVQGRAIQRYDWDFGDTATGTGQITNHTYTHPGTYIALLTVTDDNGGSEMDCVRIAVSANGGLLSGMDVGSVEHAGNGEYDADGDRNRLYASGTDIWGQDDAFHFEYTKVRGDVEIISRIVSVEQTHVWAKAGVMIRESLDANARHAMVCLTARNGAAFQRRRTAGGWSDHTGIEASAPHWVRLVRKDDVFTGYVSADGIDWTELDSITLRMPCEVHVGLVVTAHDNTRLCEGHFAATQIR